MSRSPTKNSHRDRSKRKKRVTFHPSTILCDSDHIALTITRHSFIHDKGFTQYFIKLMCRGEEWTLHKRYRDFYELNQELMKENMVYNIDLPKLPEKRWFERQRWINRADEKYGWIRRIQLQDYLRSLVKIRVLRNESLSFWKFICMPKRVMYNTDQCIGEEEERLSFQSSASERSYTTNTPNKNNNNNNTSNSGSSSVGHGRATTSTGSILKPIDRKGSSKSSAGSTATRNGQHDTTATTNNKGNTNGTIEEEDNDESSDETKSAAYNPEKDLELFQESVQLAASEAVLRSRYGTSRTTNADIDNIAALVRTNSISINNPHILSTNSYNNNGSIKLNKVYDDNGEEIIPEQVNEYNESNMKDLSYLAASNARLNVRLTSSDTLPSPASSSSLGGLITTTNTTTNTSLIHHMNENTTNSGIKAPIPSAPTAWSNTDLATALQAMNSKETFDMDLHFSGPRSGPPSVHASPNTSTTKALSESDLHLPVQILPPPPLSSRYRQGSDDDTPELINNGQNSTALPQPLQIKEKEEGDTKHDNNNNNNSNNNNSNNSNSAKGSSNSIISSIFPSSYENKHTDKTKNQRSSKSDH